MSVDAWKKEVEFLYTHTLSYSLPSFERFLMTPFCARSILVNFTLTKNLTSNGSKPIGVLTRTKSSCSDERKPISYSLPDFQLHRSKFLVHSPPPPLTRKEGGRHGGKPCPDQLLTIQNHLQWPSYPLSDLYFFTIKQESNEEGGGRFELIQKLSHFMGFLW